MRVALALLCAIALAAAALRLLLFTGARLREILHLRWEHVDFDRGLLLLPDSKTGKKAIVLFCRNYPEDYPEVEALVLARQSGLRIVEVPVRMKERGAGKSSITSMRALYYMAKVLLAIGIGLIRKA